MCAETDEVTALILDRARAEEYTNCGGEVIVRRTVVTVVADVSIICVQGCVRIRIMGILDAGGFPKRPSDALLHNYMIDLKNLQKLIDPLVMYPRPSSELI